MKNNIMNSKQIKSILMDFKSARNKYNNNIIFNIDKKNIQTWYILIYNLDKPFNDGYYIVKVVAAKDHPKKPPIFEFLTPQGVFKIGEKPCISIGHYHGGAYPSTLGISGFCHQLVNALICYKGLEYGISIIDTSEDEKIALAKKSLQYCEKLPEWKYFKNSPILIYHKISKLLPKDLSGYFRRWLLQD